MGTDNQYLQSKNKWNIRNLDPPPVTTYKVSTAIDITGLRNCFEAAVEFFEHQSHLENDVALLSRMVFKMKNKFRTDKGFKFMQKLNRSLRKYQEVNFLSIIQNFYELLPKFVQPGNYLPTGDMLDYVIIRLQGLTALMCYISETAKTGAHLMDERIAIGHFWQLAFFAYALLSRIWFLCNDIINFCCKLYKEILPVKGMLEKRNNTWVGNEYEFPVNLESWLNSEHLRDKLFNNDLKITLTEKILDDSDTECIADELIHHSIKSEHLLKEQTTATVKQKSAFELLLEDVEVGEAIEEDEFLSIKKIKNKTKKNKLQDNVTSNVEDDNLPPKKIKTKRTKLKNNIKGKESNDVSSLQIIGSINSFKLLKIFLKKETNLRIQDRSKCVYKNLDGLQWNMLQNKIKKFSKKATADESKQTSYLNKAIRMLKSLL